MKQHWRLFTEYLLAPSPLVAYLTAYLPHPSAKGC